MAKVKVHNKGKKVVVVNGIQILPEATVEIEDSVLKIPAVKSLINRGFIETSSRGNSNTNSQGKGNGNTNSQGKGETPNTETGSETPNTEDK